MVVLSFLLVIVAAVTLLIGLFQDTLAWIWTSIASCVVAMIFLGIGVLQRRGRQPEALGEPTYGPGAAAVPTATTGGGRAGPGDVGAVPKRTVSDARAAVEESAGDVATAAEGARGAEPPAAPERVAETAAEGARAAEPPAAPERVAETAAEGTRGARAYAALANVKGLGPAKQDALLERFGSLEAIAGASKRELMEVKGIGDRVADEIKANLS